jgi:hypothetical protein
MMNYNYFSPRYSNIPDSVICHGKKVTLGDFVVPSKTRNKKKTFSSFKTSPHEYKSIPDLESEIKEDLFPQRKAFGNSPIVKQPIGNFNGLDLSSDLLRQRIPLCIHGIRYKVDTFLNSHYYEAEMLVVKMPKNLISEFASAAHKLATKIEPLRYDSPRRALSCCKEPQCIWNFTSNRLDGFGRKSNKTLFNEQVDNLLRYKYDFKSYFCRDTMGTIASQIKPYIDKTYMDAFILLESLNNVEAQILRTEIKIFAAFMRNITELKVTQEPEVERSFCCWTSKHVRRGSTLIDQFVDYEKPKLFTKDGKLAQINKVLDVYELAEMCQCSTTRYNHSSLANKHPYNDV